MKKLLCLVCLLALASSAGATVQFGCRGCDQITASFEATPTMLYARTFTEGLPDAGDADFWNRGATITLYDDTGGGRSSEGYKSRQDGDGFWYWDLQDVAPPQAPAVSFGAEADLPICSADNPDPAAQPGAFYVIPTEYGPDGVKRPGRILVCVERADQSGFDFVEAVRGHDTAAP